MRGHPGRLGKRL